MVNAEEWLARSDANALKPRQDGPPHLPRRSARDHLSERNREHALYDPANPSVRTRVRVTQRTSFDDCSLAGRRRMIAHERDDTEARQRALRAEADAEVVAAAEANELLELRSMGIRSVQAGSTRQAASSSSPAVTRSAQAKKAAARSSERPSPSTPPVDTWGSDNGSAPPLAAGQATAGWQVARRNYRPPPMIDGKPMDLDLSWVVAPLKREHGGFRPAGTNLAPDWKVAEEMIRHPSPPPAAAAVKAAVGPVSFAMPTSPQKVAAMRATPIRASG